MPTNWLKNSLFHFEKTFKLFIYKQKTIDIFAKIK